MHGRHDRLLAVLGAMAAAGVNECWCLGDLVGVEPVTAELVPRQATSGGRAPPQISPVELSADEFVVLHPITETLVRFALDFTTRGFVMQDIMIRIETDDFEAWKTQHYLHADNRAAFGITDGPAYQDIDNPNAALFHIRTDDMDRAMQWFQSDVFKGASRLAKVTGRVFYLAQRQT